MIFRKNQFSKCSSELLGVLTNLHKLGSGGTFLDRRIAVRVACDHEKNWGDALEIIWKSPMISLGSQNLSGNNRTASTVLRVETIRELCQHTGVKKINLFATRKQKILIDIPAGVIVNFNGIVSEVVATTVPFGPK